MQAISNRILGVVSGVVMGAAAAGAAGQCDPADLFGPDQQFATGNFPNSVAIGDLNGDGTPDLATANGGSNSVSVLLGNGDGTFQARQDFATGVGPRSVAIGDLNGDDTPDLAVANTGTFSNPGNSVSVLLNQCGVSCPADLTGDGDLNFFDVSAFLSAFNAMDPIADFNGDGLINFDDVQAYLAAFNAGCP
jgi:hypothetical protein